MVAQLIDPPKPDEIVESPELEFYLPPSLFEAITAQFMSQTGRLPKNW